MSLTIEPRIFELFPGLRVVVVVASGLDNSGESPAVSAEWSEAWGSAEAAVKYGNAQSHPRVRPWRDAWERLGISGRKFPSSIEAILRRAMKGGRPFSINPLVDFYNSVSLRHVVPAGGWDLEEVEGRIRLRLSAADDTFQALDEEEPSPAHTDEVAYVSGSTVLTRHFVWKQSRQGLIGPGTTEALLVSEILQELPEEAVGEVATDLERGLRRHFGARTSTAVLRAGEPAAEW